jgi:O-antigen ligase
VLSTLATSKLALYLGIALVAIVWSIIGFGRLVAIRDRKPATGALTVLWVVGICPILLAVLSPRSYAVGFTNDPVAASEVDTMAGQLVTFAAWAVCLAVVLVELGRRERRSCRFLIVSAMLFYAAPIVSGLLGDNGGFGRDLFIAPAVLLALYMAPRPSVEQVLNTARRVLRFYTWGSLIALAVVPTWATYRILMSDGSQLSRNYFGLPQIIGVVPYPDILGGIAAGALVLEVAAVGRKRGWQFHAGAAASVAVLAESRTGLIAAVIGLMFLSAKSRGSGVKSSVRSRFVVVALVGLLALLITFVQQYAPALLSSGADLGTVNGRTVVWQYAFDEFRHNPILGYGPTIFSPAYRALKLGPGQAWIGQAHNQVFQSMGESGILGLLALAFLVGALLFGASRARVVTLGASTALLAVVFIRMLTDSLLDNRGVDSGFLLVPIIFLLFLSGLSDARSRTRVPDVPSGANLDLAGTTETR